MQTLHNTRDAGVKCANDKIKTSVISENRQARCVSGGKFKIFGNFTHSDLVASNVVNKFEPAVKGWWGVHLSLSINLLE